MAGSGDEQTHSTGGSQTKSTTDNVQLKGKNTFAVPRNVRIGGTNQRKPKLEDAEGEGEKPKSNDEFRNILLKKT